MGFGEKRRGGSGQVAVRGRRDFFLDQVSNISRGLWLGLYEVEALAKLPGDVGLMTSDVQA